MNDEIRKGYPFHLCIYVYTRDYSYDEVKAIAELTHCQAAQELDYEDLCIIGVTMAEIWESCGHGTEYPWMEVEPQEIGYVQSYAKRTAEDYINLYNTIKNTAKEVSK